MIKKYMWKDKHRSIYEIAKMEKVTDGALRRQMRRHPELCIEQCLARIGTEKSGLQARKHELNGESKTLDEWADTINANHNTFRNRVAEYGLEMSIAMGTPRKQKKYKRPGNSTKRAKANWKIPIPEFDPDLPLKNLIKGLRKQGFTDEQILERYAKTI